MAAALGTLATIGAVVTHVRLHVVPPNCRDARTLALVHASLMQRFGLPVTTRVENIQMLAGGPLAFRFVCEADLAGYDTAGPLPGTRPGFVRYTSQLADAGQRLHVTVEVLPLLMWEAVR